jgi:hypothetical protein
MAYMVSAYRDKSNDYTLTGCIGHHASARFIADAFERGYPK